jgi:hypothetical protein
VRKEALLGPQREVVTNIFSKRIPSAAILSILGVLRTGFPAQLIPSHLWSSVIKNTKLGLFPPLAQDCGPKAKAVPNNPAEETLIKSRLEIFSTENLLNSRSELIYLDRIPLSARAGSMMMALNNLKTASTVIPTRRNGRRRSHTNG